MGLPINDPKNIYKRKKMENKDMKIKWKGKA